MSFDSDNIGEYPVSIHPGNAKLSPEEMDRVELGVALHNVLRSHNEPNRIVLLKPEPVSDNADGKVFDFLYGDIMPPGFKGQCRVQGNILLSVTVEDFPDFPSDNY